MRAFWSREPDSGRGNRDAVDIPAPATLERVPQPPPFRLKPAERVTHRVFRPRPDAAAGGQAHPATNVEQQRGHHQRQQPGQSGRADPRGGRRERAGDNRCRTARGGPAQSPGLLTARKARPEHPKQARSRLGRTASCLLRQLAPAHGESHRRRVQPRFGRRPVGAGRPCFCLAMATRLRAADRSRAASSSAGGHPMSRLRLARRGAAQQRRPHTIREWIAGRRSLGVREPLGSLSAECPRREDERARRARTHAALLHAKPRKVAEEPRPAALGESSVRAE